ncbi:MAG: hypothetical protein JSR17_04635 [Proteobacteria bacterium]|nr:hypothetical protein [Pseudomonadota bacterium]
MLSHLIHRSETHSHKTLEWVLNEISTNGKLTRFPDDLTCYYKLPTLLTISGKLQQAQIVLSYIESAFFKQGNKLCFEDKKTNNPLMAKFWGYVLGWIGYAAQKLGRFDLSYPLFNYLKSFQSQDHGGFATSGPWGSQNPEMDVITSAQCGHLSLYFGDLKMATKTGEFLGWHITHQSEANSHLYLFVDNDKKFVTQYPQELEIVYKLKKAEPQQAYFMIGFPCAFLVQLYNATANPDFLHYAKQYADYALGCHESIKSFHFSHKVAWAMSLLYRATKEEKYLILCQQITDYLISIQTSDGKWLTDQDAIHSLDQSIENAIWLKEIASQLS